MTSLMKPLALALLLSVAGGTAMAADAAMKDCCDKCDCCKEKAADGQKPAPSPEHKH